MPVTPPPPFPYLSLASSVTRQKTIVKSGHTGMEAAHTGLANATCHTCIIALIPSSNTMGPFTSVSGTHGIPGGTWALLVNYHFFNPRLAPSSMIKIQRKYIPITQPLEIGGVGRGESTFLKVITSLTFPLLNNTPLSLHLLLQTLTSACWLLNVTLPGHFGDRWLGVPPGPSSQLPLTVSPFTNCPEPGVATTPYLFHITLFGKANCFKSPGTHFVGA